MNWEEIDDSFEFGNLTKTFEIPYPKDPPNERTLDFYRTTHPEDGRPITIMTESGHFYSSPDPLWTEGHPTFEELKESINSDFNFDED
jgi:hypothetical protein